MPPSESKQQHTPHWITRRSEELKALHKYVEDLERRNEFLLEEMLNISQGVYLLNSPETWTGIERLTMRAATAIKRCVSEFTVRAKPAAWW